MNEAAPLTDQQQGKDGEGGKELAMSEELAETNTVMHPKSHRGSIAAPGAAFPMSPFDLVASMVVPWGILKMRHGHSVPPPPKTQKVFFLASFRITTPISGPVPSMLITLPHQLCLDVNLPLTAHPGMFLRLFWDSS